MACLLFGSNDFLNQCWFIVNWTIENKFQGNFDQTMTISIQWNSFEKVVCKMVTILYLPQCADPFMGPRQQTCLFSVISDRVHNHKTHTCMHNRRKINQQNSHHFADMLKISFLCEKSCILVEISLKFVLNGSNQQKVLVQIMPWWQTGYISHYMNQNDIVVQFIDAHGSPVWGQGNRNVGNTWWRHQMETFLALLALCAGNSPVTGEFHTQNPVTRSFYVFFHLCLNKWLSKQSWGWWFEKPSR